MKITLPQNHLKEFIKLSSFIKNDDILIDQYPHFGCIKIEIKNDICFLVKSGLTEFIKYNFDLECSSVNMLVDEQRLVDFISTSNKDTVTIELTESKLILSDGYSKPKFGVRLARVEDFPKQPKLPKESIRINKDILSKLSEASIFVGTDELRPFILYVHLKDNIIWTSDAQTSSISSIIGNFPLISLSPKETKLISNFEYIDFYFIPESEDGGNWNLFRYKDCLYGSRMKEIGRDMTDYILKFKESINRENYFKINVSEFSNFCNSVISYTKKIDKNFCSSRVLINDKGLSDTQGNYSPVANLSYIDAENAIEYELPVTVVNTGYIGGFYFSHKTFLKVLETIKYKDICISDCKPLQDGGVSNACAIWSLEDSSFCFIYNKMQS